MTNRMIENRVKKIQELEQQKALLESQIEKLKNELKADLEEKGVEVVKTDKGTVVRWQEVSQNKFDSAWLKNENPNLYDKYKKQSVVHRFTWSVA